ncbi:MAG: hypothetical protein U0840_21470 [Gemmataceae bacterium]
MTRLVSLVVPALLALVIPARAQFIISPNNTGGITLLNRERLTDPASNVALPGTFRSWVNPMTGQLEYRYLDINGQPRGSMTTLDPFTGGTNRITYSKLATKGTASSASNSSRYVPSTSKAKPPVYWSAPNKPAVTRPKYSH